MSLTKPSLTAALEAIGNAHVYVGDPFTVSGLSALGAKDGAIQVNIEEVYNDLTAEQTGNTVHQRTVMGVNVSVTVPLVIGDADVYASICSTGEAGGGWSTPQDVVTTSVVIIPDSEVSTSLAYDGTTWTPAAPEHAVWLWRAVPQTPARSYSYESGGKMVVEVTFQAMYYGANPEGHKVYTIGDPAAQGVTLVRV